MTRYLIFTDLDGTLLDHDSYSWAPAQAALEHIAALDIPLILNSSKTFAEMRELRRQLGNRHPFLVENGSALYLPAGYFDHADGPGGKAFELLRFAPAREQILTEIDRLRRQHGFLFRGFEEISAEELAGISGLSPAAAQRAKQRDCSEPVLWLGDEQSCNRFEGLLRGRGLRLLRGGRFLHVMGDTDKAVGMNWLVARYRRRWPGQAVVSVALGDSPNDLGMLEAADIAVVIPPAHGEPLRLEDGKNAIYPNLPGPAGWQQAIEKILQEGRVNG